MSQFDYGIDLQDKAYEAARQLISNSADEDGVYQVCVAGIKVGIRYDVDSANHLAHLYAQRIAPVFLAFGESLLKEEEQRVSAKLEREATLENKGEDAISHERADAIYRMIQKLYLRGGTPKREAVPGDPSC
jgi:hypothetical protein